jgi:predicted DNA-binding transcriptional regulator
MFSQQDKDNVLEAIESLKKYRRADLADEDGKNILELLYTDLLPNEHILKKSLKENTTFLIGRKGTGKSTIFLRIEQELRKKDYYLPCYLDVKTIYESAQSEYLNLDYLREYLSSASIQKYLIERSFVQNVLKRIIEELNTRYSNNYEKFKQLFGVTKAQLIREDIQSILNRIEDNEALKEIEIPVIKNISTTTKSFDENKTSTSTKAAASTEVKLNPLSPDVKIKAGSDAGRTTGKTDSMEIEETFSGIFLKVFQIKDYIEEIKEILKEIKIRNIVILLDDFSEIEDEAIKTFVDVILAPLNNWSEEFIKFKVAAYPNRIYYGKIDPGKVDTINLDFYNLYSEFDRNRMEEGAIDFTKRLIEKRFQYYTKKSPEVFFDVSKLSIDEYYEVLFQTSMNVPRIMGYILSYCFQSKIIYNKPITKQDIESAAQSYYEDKIEPFFHITTFSLLSMNEKIDTLQLKELLGRFVDRMIDTKRKIVSGEISDKSYLKSIPYASHFYLANSIENFLKTLELNFFISKYNEMSDRDGQPSSVYCLNYGLAQEHNLLWGKPKGNEYRKYFIGRVFNFNSLIKEFLASSKSIHCTNETCNETFTQDQLGFLEFADFKCNKCQSAVIIEAISLDIKSELEKIEQKNLLKSSDMQIIMELINIDEPKMAREIAEELDISYQSVALKGRMLDLKKGLVKRERPNENQPYTYTSTELAQTIYK